VNEKIAWREQNGAARRVEARPREKNGVETVYLPYLPKRLRFVDSLFANMAFWRFTIKYSLCILFLSTFGFCAVF